MIMRTTSSVLLLAALAACRTSNLGACTADAQCPQGSVCDTAAAVCVAKAGACLPACDATHVCNTTTLACDPVDTAQVAVTSPADGAVVTGTLQATATAHATGGVSALRFDLRSTGGALLASGAGTASGTATWTAAISLAGVAPGAAILTAVATTPQGAATSPAVSVTVQQNTACTPACDTAHVCVSGSCQPAGTTAIAITAPAANAFVSGTLQAAATATAPGGVTAVRFDLSRGATLVAFAAGVASTSAPSSFSAALALASVADGPASLTATVTAAAGNATSAPVSVTVDQTAPVITLQTDGTAAFYGAGQTAVVTAQIADATSGVRDSTVALLIAGHAAVPGVAGTGGVYTFSVLIDDSIVAAGASAAVHYQIAASDNAGNLASVSGDPRQVIQADRDAPAITAISYSPAALAGPSGHLLFGGPAGGSVLVRATLTDFAGVGATCLRLAGETSACLHPGTRLIGTNTWSFTLPDPAPPQDGTVATSFTLQADDTLAATLSGASKLEHQASSVQTVYFDYGPTIAIFADATAYARTAVLIPVSALITDPSGIPDGGVFLNGTLQPSSRDGGLFVFRLDPSVAPAGVEGAYNFQVSATDNLANTADAGGSRIIDDAAPDASVRIFKGIDPNDGGVTYPAAVAGTGWDGTQFIYNDTVHVKGTLTDVSGLASANLHIDYVQVDGGVSAGSTQSICTVGATSCAFDVPIALNAPGNGAFNTFTKTHPMVDILAPSDKLKIVIDSTDAAKSANGVAAAHTGASSNDAQTTRLLWQMYLPASVSGLGIHPDGDLIVTLDGGTDTVVAMRPDDGGVRWSFGGGVGLGAVDGTPAIGAGDGGNARVYVAAQNGGVFALNPNGSEAWHYFTSDVLNVGPAVVSPTVAPTTDQVIVPGALTSSKIYSIAQGVLLNATAPAVADSNSSSAPFVLGTAVFFGDDSEVERFSISALGALGSRTVGGNAAVFKEVITDGTSIFGWRAGVTNGLTSLDTSLGVNWSRAVAPNAAGAVALDGSIVVSLTGGAVNLFDPNPNGTGASSTLFNLGGSGRAPLIGWDGVLAHEHLYLPRDSAVTYAYDRSGTLLWYADPNGATYRALTMDCSGRLFGATNGLATGQSLVYALITDDRGLADTAWPSYRLNARNTGNAVSTSGILKSGGTCTQ